MTSKFLTSLQDTVRKVCTTGLQRRIQKQIIQAHPEADQLLKALHYPKLHIKIKKHGLKSYSTGKAITLTTNEDADIKDEADAVYAAFIDLAEQKGLANDALLFERRAINARLYQDGDGDCTRFKTNDLTRSLSGRNAKILKDSFDSLESFNLPQCDYILDTLRRNNATINIGPSYGGALSGGFSPDTKELTLYYYDPEDDDADISSRVALTLLHETCHFDQDQKGITADSTTDATEYRELFHLNELQAHNLQYKTALELFTQTQFYTDFSRGKMDIHTLVEKLKGDDSKPAKVTLNNLCTSQVGNTILNNLQHRTQNNLDITDLEAVVKEALCHGDILNIAQGEITYDDTLLSRMQRYAHSHIAVMNFGQSGSDGQKYDAAVSAHFSAPIGLSDQGNTVHFAKGDLEFTSPVTRRSLSVKAVEMIWGNSGFDQNHAGLGNHPPQNKTAPTQDKDAAHKKRSNFGRTR